MEKNVKMLKMAVAEETKRCEFRKISPDDQIDGRFSPIAWNLTIMVPSKKMLQDERCLMLAMNQNVFASVMRTEHANRLKTKNAWFDHIELL